jgi:hypothetical protein
MLPIPVFLHAPIHSSIGPRAGYRLSVGFALALQLTRLQIRSSSTRKSVLFVIRSSSLYVFIGNKQRRETNDPKSILSWVGIAPSSCAIRIRNRRYISNKKNALCGEYIRLTLSVSVRELRQPYFNSFSKARAHYFKIFAYNALSISS